MRKMARASILLIAVGIVLFPEAYTAHTGELGLSGGAVHGVPRSSPTLFLWRGQTLEGNFTASAPVDFYIMDESNYLAFAESQPWRPLTSLLDVSKASFLFTAPTSGYYRIVVNLKPPQERADLILFMTFYGIDRDHYDSGLAFILTGVVLGIIALITFLRSRFLLKAPYKRYQPSRRRKP